MKLKRIHWLVVPAAAALMAVVQVHAQDETVTAAEQPSVETTATQSSDVSVSDIEQLINLPITSSIKEYQEDLAKQKGIFQEPGAIERIFQKTKPKFIYFPEGADPMIIPWIREQVMAQEKFEEATIATANKDYDKAIAILREVREKFTNTPEGQKAPAEIDKISQLKVAAAGTDRTPGPTAPEAAPVGLPDWIKKNSSAVLLTSTPVVLVGNDFLREGDAVPRYPGVKVKTITDSEVIFVYQNKEFVVEVVGSF